MFGPRKKDHWEHFRKHAYKCIFEAIELLFVLISDVKKLKKSIIQ